MINLLKEGGGPMLFVVAFGLAAFGAAALFAARGDRRRLGFILGMSAATLLSVLGGIAADLAAVGHHALERCPATHLDLTSCVLVGFAESMAPGIVGFTLLSVTALMIAVGLSRSSRAAETPSQRA